MTLPDTDPRTNPAVPKPPPSEPIRNTLLYIGVLIVVVLTALIVMGEYSIPYHRVLTHAMVSAPRKVDPVNFDLTAFLERIPA